MMNVTWSQFCSLGNEKGVSRSQLNTFYHLDAAQIAQQLLLEPCCSSLQVPVQYPHCSRGKHNDHQNTWHCCRPPATRCTTTGHLPMKMTHEHPEPMKSASARFVENDFFKHWKQIENEDLSFFSSWGNNNTINHHSRTILLYLGKYMSMCMYSINGVSIKCWQIQTTYKSMQLLSKYVKGESADDMAVPFITKLVPESWVFSKLGHGSCKCLCIRWAEEPCFSIFDGLQRSTTIHSNYGAFGIHGFNGNDPKVFMAWCVDETRTAI